MNRQNRLQHHVTFCQRDQFSVGQGGREAELATVDFLIENLKPHLVGDYRILVNYNIPQPGANTLEVDVVVIDKFGVFLLEVKSWFGLIEATDGDWLIDRRHSMANPLDLINFKAKVLQRHLFDSSGRLPGLRGVSVTGMVVLYQGRDLFINNSHKDDQAVVGLDDELLQRLSSTQIAFHGNRSRLLDDDAIQRVRKTIYDGLTVRTSNLVGSYRVLGELSFGDLFDAYEAQHVVLENRRVRLKRYQLQSLKQRGKELSLRQFRRSAEVLSEIRPHPHILNTIDFIANPDSPDLFFEVTELVAGKRLDEIIVLRRAPMPLTQQLDVLEPLCDALTHIHTHSGPDGRPNPVYHRNISPETVFVTHDGIVKLADFDFAKFGKVTITSEKAPLIEKPYTPPEILDGTPPVSPATDIYSLGVLWYDLAALPAKDRPFRLDQAAALIGQLRLPEAARDLMARMVARNSGDRPQSAAEVRQALQQLRV